MIVGATAVLVFGRLGGVHAPTARFYIATNRARGLIPGAQVWLDGVSVGSVRWVRFQPPTTDTARRLLVAVDVLAEVRPRIRRTTRVTIAPGGDMLGSPVIQMVGGDARAPAIAAGDTLVAGSIQRFVGAREQLAIAAQDLPVVLDNFDAVRGALSSHSGTIGAFGNEGSTRPLRVLRGEAERLAGDTAYRRGTAALVLTDGFAAHVRAVVARADSLARNTSATASVNQRTRDSLVHAVSAVDSELGALRARLARVQTPATTDTTLASLRAEADAAHTHLRALEADLAHHPLRYLAF